MSGLLSLYHANQTLRTHVLNHRWPFTDDRIFRAKFLRRFLPAVAEKQHVVVVAMGIVANHVHLVLELSPVVDIPKLAQVFKGASARSANRDSSISKNGIKWAKGYDLRSVSPNNLSKAVDYVNSQAVRHSELAIAQ